MKIFHSGISAHARSNLSLKQGLSCITPMSAAIDGVCRRNHTLPWHCRMAGGCLAWTWLWLTTLTCANAGIALCFTAMLSQSMHCLLACTLGLGPSLLHDCSAMLRALAPCPSNGCLNIVPEWVWLCHQLPPGLASFSIKHAVSRKRCPKPACCSIGCATSWQPYPGLESASIMHATDCWLHLRLQSCFTVQPQSSSGITNLCEDADTLQELLMNAWRQTTRPFW